MARPSLIYLLSIVITQCFSIKVYQSNIGNNYGVAGLHYLKDDNQTKINFSNSLTICLRFNYQKLNNKILHIKGMKSYISIQCDWSFVYFFHPIKYVITFE